MSTDKHQVTSQKYTYVAKNLPRPASPVASFGQRCTSQDKHVAQPACADCRNVHINASIDYPLESVRQVKQTVSTRPAFTHCRKLHTQAPINNPFESVRQVKQTIYTQLPSMHCPVKSVQQGDQTISAQPASAHCGGSDNMNKTSPTHGAHQGAQTIFSQTVFADCGRRTTMTITYLSTMSSRAYPPVLDHSHLQCAVQWTRRCNADPTRLATHVR